MVPPRPSPPVFTPPAPSPPPGAHLSGSGPKPNASVQLTFTVTDPLTSFTAMKTGSVRSAVAARANVSPDTVAISASFGSSGATVIQVDLPASSNESALALANTMAAEMNTPAMVSTLTGMTGATTPNIVDEPGNVLVRAGSADANNMALIPGTTGPLVPKAKVDEWVAIKNKWAGTQHANKSIPVHIVDPATLPCLLSSESSESGTDTVPLKRDAPLNCDGTVHQRNDNKPMRRHAKAHIDINPTAS